MVVITGIRGSGKIDVQNVDENLFDFLKKKYAPKLSGIL